MIAFDLQCGDGHRFEAWFRSSADYDAQAAKGWLVCAVCTRSDVTKAAMAPAVHGTYADARQPRPRSRTTPVMQPAATDPRAEAVRMLAAALAAKQAEMLPQSRWVGDDFAQQVRAIAAQGDGAPTTPAPSPAPDTAADEQPAAPPPAIHGRATQAEIAELIDEGHGVLPLLVPFTPPDQAH